MIQNLKYIQTNGIKKFLKNEQDGNALPVAEQSVVTTKHAIPATKPKTNAQAVAQSRILQAETHTDRFTKHKHSKKVNILPHLKQQT